MDRLRTERSTFLQVSRGKVGMDFWEAVEKRRAIRDFTADPVPDDALTRALEAAKQSPSPLDSQPWRFIVFTGEGRDHLCSLIAGSTRLLEDLFPLVGEDVLAHAARFLGDLGGAPTVVVATTPKTEVDYDSKVNLIAVGGACLALQLSLAAEGLGSVSVTSAVWVEDKIRSQLGLGDEVVAAILPVGYPRTEAGPKTPRRDCVHYVNKWPEQAQ